MSDEIKEQVAEINPDALLADGFEQALIGYVERSTQPPLALYDRQKCIEILMLRDHMSINDANEFFEFNVIGAWMGDNTPAFATILQKS
jgi:hypothetical protein